MAELLVVSLALVLVIVALALARELRLRRTLQRLLTALLNSWRTTPTHPHPRRKREPNQPAHGDRDTSDTDQRLS